MRWCRSCIFLRPAVRNHAILNPFAFPSLLGENAARLRFMALPLALLPYTIASLLDARGWHSIMCAMSPSAPPFLRLWLVRVAGEAVNSAAPTGIGGEPVKAVLIRGDGVSGSEATAAEE